MSSTEDERSKVERIKESSDFLVGTLPEELTSDEPNVASDTYQVLKFHGIYQQDDREIRKERAKQGLGKDWIYMVRASIPGGVLTGDQYLVMDRLADEVGDGSLRVTTRQGIQYHHARKGGLGHVVRTLNENLVTTLAACGDNVRNVMCCPGALVDRRNAELQSLAAEVSRQVKPKTQAYWDLWVDGERAVSAVAPHGEEDDAGSPEPLYGPTYLPRKFKIGFAFPGDNCVDVYTNDLGIVPHIAGDGSVEALTVCVGGGLGMTHNTDGTYPRLAEPLASVAPDELVDVVKTIIGIQRDHGNRADRKFARMKYLVDAWGLDAFKAEVEGRLGRSLKPARELSWEDTDDHLGWQPQGDGNWALGVRVPNGRIVDNGASLRSGLRRIVERYGAGVRFTPRQDVLLTDLPESARGEVGAELASHGIATVGELAPVERYALACPAMPTCGLAISEAERVAPDMISAVHAELDRLGLGEEPVHVRMTGCPNGCARPYSTEIGVVGRGKDAYAVFLGGDALGTRLNGLYCDRVKLDQLVDVLRPVLTAFRDERAGGETFGDYCDRVGIETLRERFEPDPPQPERKKRAAQTG